MSSIAQDSAEAEEEEPRKKDSRRRWLTGS